MKKFLFLLLLVTSIGLVVQAQDIIYLNNGSVIKGKVIKNDQIKKIVVKNGDTLNYRDTEVRQVQIGNEQVVVPQTPDRPVYKDFSSQNKGYWCSAEFWGGGVFTKQKINNAVTKRNTGAIELDFVNGYRFSEFIKVGAGVGVRYYFDSDRIRKDSLSKSSCAVPIFLDIRGNIISQQTRMFSVYWNFQVGYCIGDNFFYSPTLGFRIGEKRNDFIVGVSYIGQVLSNNVYDIKYANIFSLKIGYEF